MTASGTQGTAPRKILVIGLGNPDRGDDGIGTRVVHDLVGTLPPDVTVLARRGDLLSLIEDWAGFDGVVCIDAAAPRGVPGRICRIDLNSAELPRDVMFTSSHALGLPEAIELARALALAPRQLIVYAVEGGSFEGGTPLTPAVAAAARVVAGQVAAEVGRLRRCTANSRPGTLHHP
jgi:hydrogenase maturation protease